VSGTALQMSGTALQVSVVACHMSGTAQNVRDGARLKPSKLLQQAPKVSRISLNLLT